jgi:hypothetical protein
MKNKKIIFLLFLLILNLNITKAERENYNFLPENLSWKKITSKF